MKIIAGIDIGGTKCAISFAQLMDGEITFLDKVRWETDVRSFDNTLNAFITNIENKLSEHADWELAAIGISCGGPLDPEKGLILAPPNLPYWDGVDIYTPLTEKFGVPVAMRNDADACALAEWKLGAGKGARNMIFLTFGTGIGAGLILNGALYSGSSFMAGEVGHMRLENDGPYGYGKYGSFEGFCSGGGIANLGRMKAKEAIAAGNPPAFAADESCLDKITTKDIADAMAQGDELAKEIFDTVGSYLGRGISILVDVLNPEVIVIGSIYVRQQQALDPCMYAKLAEEALPISRKACRIVPAGLGEKIGDYAAVTVGMIAMEQ